MNLGTTVKKISDGAIGMVVNYGRNVDGGFNWVEVEWDLPEGRLYGLSKTTLPVYEVKQVCSRCRSDLTRDGICKECSTLNF